MSSDATATARRHPDAALGDRPPPEIRVDDEDGAVKPTPADSAAAGAADASWPGGERRRSMPVSHGRHFVDEPYVFSLSQALAMTGRRRSEPLTDAASAETRDGSAGGSGSGGSTGSSPRRLVFVDQLASNGQRTSAADARRTASDSDRRGSVGAAPRTSPTAALPSLDELSRLHPVAGDSSSVSPDSDEEQLAGAAAGSHFLALPQTSDYLTVPARRHSVALVQPISSRLLDVIAEETAVAADSKNLASSRRYSLSCHLNT